MKEIGSLLTEYVCTATRDIFLLVSNSNPPKVPRATDQTLRGFEFETRVLKCALIRFGKIHSFVFSEY